MTANPRFDFADHRTLYKLYVVRAPPRPEDPPREDPAVDFLRVFLPALRPALGPPG